MKTMFGRLAGALLALFLMSDLAAAQSKITIAVGGDACLCYLPTVLAKQLGEFDKAGLAVELVDLKGLAQCRSAAAPMWLWRWLS
jgi:NitT/TauT family transport system substrate-binding protein